MSIIPKQNSSYVLFNDIDPYCETQKIKVHILHLWKPYKSNIGLPTEMVLLDQEGTRMHATVEEEFMKKHNSFLEQGQSLSINAFQLKEYLKDYRTSPLPHKITFLRTTKIKSIENFVPQNPEKYFVSFHEIFDGNLDTDILIDVIGQVVNVGTIEEIKRRGKSGTTTKLDMILRDTVDVNLTCTLWGEYAKKAFDYTEQHKSSIVICVIRFACIKKYARQISISNAFNATQLEFDSQTNQVENFKAMLQGESQIINYSDKSQVSLGSSCVNYHEEFFGLKNKRKTIAGIIESIEGGGIVTCAIVTAIDNSKKWHYLSCEKCNLKVQQYGEDSDDLNSKPLFNCKTCGDIENVVASYYTIMRVTDASKAETKFLLFDTACEKLTKISATELVKQNEEEDPSFLPDALTNLIGNKYLFKITVPVQKKEDKKENKSPYVVDLVWDDQDEIDRFDEQSFSEAPLMLTNGDEVSEISVESSITPTSKKEGKRFSPESSHEGQSSTTKKFKAGIKLENIKKE